ncbi:hypothetical protein HZA40_04140, partial [Candidatus Peregrinibacteria bacterium]|nr:hypothetical protein [Candidatus Peregrinibacteria bacterium]
IFEENFEAKHHQAETTKTFKVWNAYGAIFAGENFAFMKDFQNFEIVEKGVLIGYQGSEPVYAEKDSRMLFLKMNSQVVPGERACTLLDRDAKNLPFNVK